MASGHCIRGTSVSCEYGQGLASPNVPADDRVVVGASEDEPPQALVVRRECDPSQPVLLNRVSEMSGRFGLWKAKEGQNLSMLGS